MSLQCRTSEWKRNGVHLEGKSLLCTDRLTCNVFTLGKAFGSRERGTDEVSHSEVRSWAGGMRFFWPRRASAFSFRLPLAAIQSARRIICGKAHPHGAYLWKVHGKWKMMKKWLERQTFFVLRTNKWGMHLGEGFSCYILPVTGKWCTMSFN